MSGAAQNRQGAATRLRLVKAAERLFATHGVDAVSVRAVNAAAGLGAASVHYHFGSKDELLRAVLMDVGAPVRDEISANVAALAAQPRVPSSEALVRAVTEPYLKLLLRHRVRGMRWIKIIAQISQEDHPVLLAAEQRLPDELFAQVQRVFPDSDPVRLELRWAISIMNFIQALSRADEWSRSGSRLAEPELRAFYEDLVSFVVGGVDRLLGS
ncbi:TetR/AcrR family transcriptional regulator [Mycolicibacterium sp.]|uniref:TetR/AcrR family transcriptional regulator n=1 Tax=Mycolicibacterium sp. TaxID=2320850 RepID=UPI00093BBBB4|nr:TetR/AcrR family transcriptional regulator [Mycobacterium sp. DSM 3803]OKH74023.1 TetR family transcriptional regulator [Mycobacterium sp. SWH-M3]